MFDNNFMRVSNIKANYPFPEAVNQDVTVDLVKEFRQVDGDHDSQTGLDIRLGG